MSSQQFKDRAADIDQLKTKINSYRPIPQEILSQLKEKLRIISCYTSCALDGMSFDEAETKTVLEYGKAIGGKTIREHLELLGHSEAYDFLWEASRRGITNLTLDDLLKFHQLFYYRINKPQAGKLRKGKSLGNQGEGDPVAAEQVVPILEEFIASLPDLGATRHPVNFAALLYLRLMNIQPFIENNGRIARLMMNLSLMQHGYCAIIIPPGLRHEYVTTMRVANKGGDAQPFLKFISQMAYDSHVEYLRLLQELVHESKLTEPNVQSEQPAI